MNMNESILTCAAAPTLPAPSVAHLNDGMLDPAWNKAVVTVAAYPGMANGDRLVLHWSGLDAEGVPEGHSQIRHVSRQQVGCDVVFVIKGDCIAALEGGSAQVHWTLHRARHGETVSSERLPLLIGEPQGGLLAPIVEEAVGGALDPDRVPEGTPVTIRPYPAMAEGDCIQLSWQGETGQVEDTLTVAPASVGAPLSLWIAHDRIAASLGEEVTVSYRVEQKQGKVRQSETTRIKVAPLVREPLAAPQVVGAEAGVLDVDETLDGITVVIGNAQAENGELVYLRCDGEHFNHRDYREITPETAWQSLDFIVPYRFWREHRGTVVRVSYSVERLDDVSQESEVAWVQISA
ncbi:hypothetical protein [Pseudomonas sp. B11(2017)]|uniref:hypothetical protein n=1 Tax=Pseudomonas sp. B11(2017) TaxID=1981748 RepID=UPI000A1FA060|nr:hypothetical protein [Pseudomonas sp. B11(2017)]